VSLGTIEHDYGSIVTRWLEDVVLKAKRVRGGNQVLGPVLQR
jgi:hypothetical protein